MEPASQLKWKARFEMAQALRHMNRDEEAMRAYSEVADQDRDETGARARFMLAEILYGRQQLAAALTEFQKLVYGYGGSQATEATKSWQVKGALEAGRSAGILATQNPPDQHDLWEKARKYYSFVVEHFPNTDESRAAEQHLRELPDRGRISQRPSE
jgi:tetratricopeptide (TPR) repeat protein